MVEDMCRQMCYSGHHLDIDQVCRGIDAVTQADLYTILKKMLRAPKAIGAYGRLDQLPSLQVIQDALLQAVKSL